MADDDFARLMERVRAGDPDAYAELLERYGTAIRTAVRRRLHERLRQQYDSLDFVQDVWATLLTLPPDRCQFDDPRALVGFLTRVAENKVIDVVRRRFDTLKYDVSREQPLATDAGPEPADPGPTPSQVAVAEEKLAILSGRLKDGQRAILELLRQGYTYEEIAAKLDVSVSSVDRVVRRIKDYYGI